MTTTRYLAFCSYRFPLIIPLMIYVLLTFGCSVSKVQSPEKSPTTIVILSSPNMSVPPSAAFTWLPEAVLFYNDPRLHSSQIQEMLQDAIKQNLIEKGFRFEKGSPNADIMVGYTVALESALSDNMISDRYGLLPGLRSPDPGNAKYEKGTLVIDIMDRKTRQSIWRGAIQAWIQFDLSERVRRDRIDHAVARLLDDLPRSTP